ncbi:hypothetical protein BB558_006757 [Smittium angustum]|uniref:NDT80 domain-containing protein n=1 Tax=Smittium angustum TaxID=133377 RepID=A0A2U1IWX5_SMIAN|nr:hypothetical protein BB558_006757 [Smittium angustum]
MDSSDQDNINRWRESDILHKPNTQYQPVPRPQYQYNQQTYQGNYGYNNQNTDHNNQYENFSPNHNQQFQQSSFTESTPISSIRNIPDPANTNSHPSHIYEPHVPQNMDNNHNNIPISQQFIPAQQQSSYYIEPFQSYPGPQILSNNPESNVYFSPSNIKNEFPISRSSNISEQIHNPNSGQNLFSNFNFAPNTMNEINKGYIYRRSSLTDPNTMTSPGPSSQTHIPLNISYHSQYEKSVNMNMVHSRRRKTTEQFNFGMNESTTSFFGETNQTNQLFSLDKSKSYFVKITSKVDRGFFLSGGEWTCYRRNYFQISSCFNLLNTPPIFSEENNITTDENDVDESNSSNLNNQTIKNEIECPCIVIDSKTKKEHSVTQFLLGISAKVVTEEGESVPNTTKKVELVQHTPKRDKGPQITPKPKSIRPGGNLQIGSVGINSSIVCYERMQFKTATANNGKRRAAQQYYMLQLDLLAEVAPEKFVHVAKISSSRLVVRGRSPSHYADNLIHSGSGRFQQYSLPNISEDKYVSSGQQPHNHSNLALPSLSLSVNNSYFPIHSSAPPDIPVSLPPPVSPSSSSSALYNSASAQKPTNSTFSFNNNNGNSSGYPGNESNSGFDVDGPNNNSSGDVISSSGPTNLVGTTGNHNPQYMLPPLTTLSGNIKYQQNYSNNGSNNTAVDNGSGNPHYFNNNSSSTLVGQSGVGLGINNQSSHINSERIPTGITERQFIPEIYPQNNGVNGSYGGKMSFPPNQDDYYRYNINSNEVNNNVSNNGIVGGNTNINNVGNGNRYEIGPNTNNMIDHMSLPITQTQQPYQSHRGSNSYGSNIPVQDYFLSPIESKMNKFEPNFQPNHIGTENNEGDDPMKHRPLNGNEANNNGNYLSFKQSHQSTNSPLDSSQAINGNPSSVDLSSALYTDKIGGNSKQQLEYQFGVNSDSQLSMQNFGFTKTK